jgi:LysM repeat protein
MNTISKNFFRHRNVLLLEILIVAAGGMALHAQTAATSAQPSPGESLADMNQDVQGLIREVKDLNLQLNALQQDNNNLKSQILSKSDVQNLIDNAVAKSRADARAESRNDLTLATTALRKDIADDVAKTIDELTQATNAQLDKLAKAINDLQAKRAALPLSNIPPPHFQTTDAGSQKGVQYTVLPGDSLTKIAKKFPGTTVAEIQAFNNMSDTTVRTGQVIFVPQNAPAPTPATTAPVTPAGH